MKTTLLFFSATVVCLRIAAADPLEWNFEYDCKGVPEKLVWQTESGTSYDLFFSTDLAGWYHVAGFPKTGWGDPMEYTFAPPPKGFFKIVSVPGVFVLIPAGTFEMGDSSGEGEADELPVHSVEVSGFYLERHEVTKALWDKVRAWALGHGYTDLPEGGGKAADHPVQGIDWYAIVKWCNARSEMEGVSLCYHYHYTGTGRPKIYRTGSPDDVTCNWAADGYRLPSEAEWEKAARGGLSGALFPWGDTISHSDANFRNDGGESYASGTTGPHPLYCDPPMPYTSPVGSFAPNGYGLYDMAGNVWEWCWDWYGDAYYASSEATDPHGLPAGTQRVMRGGGWFTEAVYQRCAFRLMHLPSDVWITVGFRTARSQ